MSASPPDTIPTIATERKEPAGRGRSRGRWGLLLWAPLPLAGVYLLTVLIKFSELIATTYLDADLSSAPVIGELFHFSAHGQVVLGDLGWYSTLIFEVGTRWLPLHRQVWEGAPFVLVLAAAALIAWGAWRVAGRLGALVGGVVVLCASPAALQWLFALDDHSPTWFCLALLGALVVLVESRPPRLGTPAVTGIVAVVGVVVGVNAASDPLLVVGGLAPLLLAAGGAWALSVDRAAGRAWWWVCACTAVAAVVDLLTRALMRHENVIAAHGLATNVLASGGELSSNLTLWWQSITVLGNGNFYGETLAFGSALRVVCAVLALVAVAASAQAVWRELAHAVVRRRARTAAVIAEQTQTARGAWCIYWGSSALLLSASFIFTTNPINILSDHYLVGLVYAVAALLAVLTTRSEFVRGIVLVGTAVFALTGLVSLWQGRATGNPGNFPTGPTSGMVAKIAEREHATIGYAGYWDAAPITWATHLRIKLYPVQPCNGEKSYCRFFLHYISSWYTPRRGQRTFLITDSTQPYGSTLPVASLGHPSAVYHINELTMYIYPYDIASRIGA